MKKSIVFYLALCLVIVSPAAGQKSGFLNKVTKSVTNVSNDLLGKPDKPGDKTPEPEPPCANDQATVAMDLGGKLQLDYRELTISILGDGRILAKHTGSDEYYVAKDGVTTGPYKAGDPQIADFIPGEEKADSDDPVKMYKPYVTKSGDKFLITFAGKKYGPYGQINFFKVSGQKSKFAALVIENMVVTEEQGKKMEEAINNAKDDQERMELAMEYAQQMQQAITDGGGPESMKPKLISNVPVAGYDPLTMPNAALNSDYKYDDILITTYNNQVFDLQGKLLFTFKPEILSARNIFVNAANTKYAWYSNGKLSFSDNTSLTDLFSPGIEKTDGREFLRYMYYSPGKNAIMQYRIPF